MKLRVLALAGLAVGPADGGPCRCSLPSDDDCPAPRCARLLRAPATAGVAGGEPSLVTGGLGGNQVAIGWFGTSTSGDPNGLKNQWRYYVATSRDGGGTFTYATVTPKVIHYGDICTQGIFCGLVPGKPGNRNLADFSSIAVNPATGCLLVALPGDPQNRPDLTDGPNDFSSSTYVSRQTGGICLKRR